MAKKTLQQWIKEMQRLTEEDEEKGITALVQAPFSLTLFQGQGGDGYTGQIGVEINFPTGANDIVFHGLLTLAEKGDEEDSPTLEELPDVLLRAFGIQPDQAIWEEEEL